MCPKTLAWVTSVKTGVCGALTGCQVAQWQRICLPLQETQEIQVQCLGRIDPLEEKMATHSSGNPMDGRSLGQSQSMESHGARHD